MMIKKYTFTPIKSNLEMWDGTQLEILKNIGEGLYIEYKKDILQGPDIAKQLAAFANESGGWLFFGIEEKGPEKKAETFPGIDNKNIPILIDKIRDVATQAIQPPVDFEYKVIEGPVKEIQLEKDFSILIIGIPQGFNTPYIYAGKIYRRIADKSEPKAETDHNIIHKLWQRRENSRKSLEDFSSDIPLLPKQQSDSTWAHIYLITDLFLEDEYDFKIHDFARIMKPEIILEHGSIPMDNFFSTKNGFICRQVSDNDPSNFLLSLRWWYNGNVRLSIPINTTQYNKSDTDYQSLPFCSYKLFKEFMAIVESQGFSTIKIGDFSYFLAILINICNQYLEINNLISNNKPIYGRIIIINSWRLSPFLDDETYINNSRKYGIPVVEDRDIYLPERIDFSTLIDYNSILDNQDLQYPKCAILGILILYNLLKSVGIISDTNDLIHFKSFWDFSK